MERLTATPGAAPASAETNGELLQFELMLRPGGRIPIAHRHAAQEERFEIVSGAVRARYGRSWRDLSAGESIVIPRGTAHVLRNDSTAEARIIGELRPAMHTEEIFEAMCALAQEGRVSKSGLPSPLRMAVLSHALGQQDYAPGIPIVVQKAAFVVLAAVGRALGYEFRSGHEGQA